MSDRTGSLAEGDFFRFIRVCCVSRVCDAKKVVRRIHGHRGQLTILKDGVCVVERLVWYPAKV